MDVFDSKIRKNYLKKIKVECKCCHAIHEYEIRVQGITGCRIYASRAIDCDHHCKSCGASLEQIPENPLPYTPDPEEVKLKRCLSEIRKRQKELIPERTFVIQR